MSSYQAIRRAIRQGGAALLAAAVVVSVPTFSKAESAVSSAQLSPAPAAVNPAPNTLAGKVIDKAQAIAHSATDIFNRVPCRAPKRGLKAIGALPHVASKLAQGKPVLIVAFGSSSTQGHGVSSPQYNYPNRLAAQLRRHYPKASINIVNAGVGGEDAPEMMARLQTSVLDLHPDMVIWQVGTNAVLRNLDLKETTDLVESGIRQIKADGADLVLIDPQYSPAVNAKAESASKIVRMLGRIAELRHVGMFPRFEIMREWHEDQALAFDTFVIADGLHLNDWGYACFAQLLGDNIIKTVGEIKATANSQETALPETALHRPM